MLTLASVLDFCDIFWLFLLVLKAAITLIIYISYYVSYLTITLFITLAITLVIFISTESNYWKTLQKIEVATMFTLPY